MQQSGSSSINPSRRTHLQDRQDVCRLRSACVRVVRVGQLVCGPLRPPRGLPEHYRVHEDPVILFVRKHDRDHEYMLLAHAWRACPPDPILEHVHRAGEQGPKVAQGQLDDPRAMAG